MNNYYVVGAIAILCSRFAVTINIIPKDDKSHVLQLVASHNAHAQLHQNVLSCFEKGREMSVLETPS